MTTRRDDLERDATPAPAAPEPGTAAGSIVEESRALGRRFRGLLEAAPDAMVIANSRGRIVLANGHTARLFGYGRDELVGESIELLVPERFRGAHPGHRGAYFADPHPRPMGRGLDLQARRKDGREFPAEISLSPLETDEGVLAIAAIRDTTDRRRADQKFRALLESAPDAMVIADSEGRIVLVNAQTERLFGYTREQLLGQPVELLVPERFRGGHPGHRHAYFHRPGVRGMGEGRELFGLRRDGTEFPVEISLSPIETEEGLLVSSAIRDTSERQRLEEMRRNAQELEEERERFRRLVQSDIIGILVADLDGLVIEANDHFLRLVGRTRNELAAGAVRWDAMTPPEWRHTDQQALEELRAAGAATPWEKEFVAADGRRVPVLLGVASLDEQRRCIAYVLDMSERRRTEQALERYAEELSRRNRELESFAYVASHDLQEPLRTVASFAQLLTERYRGRLDDDADEFLDIILGAARRMHALINALLAYTRVGTRGAALVPVDADAVLEATLSDLQGAIEAAGAEISSDPLPRVRADAAQLGQLFSNLLSNALKYRRSEVPPRIHVSASPQGALWRFSVADNGLGIEERFFERIFQIFQRLHTDAEYPGTGVGLAICQKIVERHGGEIAVESRPGQGSVFSFSVPRDEPAP